jgi:hypothetical protein
MYFSAVARLLDGLHARAWYRGQLVPFPSIRQNSAERVNENGEVVYVEGLLAAPRCPADPAALRARAKADKLQSCARDAG